ncbi:hypothetical protein A3860_17340 [Niastella vici]|uniref:Uncharacterized protein n=1 Tax=Niastella vici TaxID=1703345 RepID=A0A1V9G4J7_9BACT|nr:hypothetical protein A3860_17340 [Niastella vici]
MNDTFYNGPYTGHFYCLRNRFKKGFFKTYLNTYLLFLLDISHRLGQDHEEMAKEFLSFLYYDQTEWLEKYPKVRFMRILYGNNTGIADKEFAFYDSEHFFLFTFLHAFFVMKKMWPETMQAPSNS